MAAPLDGLKVVELARILAGPWAGQTLADLGAEVIKVEAPSGDDTRQWGPPFIQREDEETAAYFHSCNRGKRSVVIDFRTPEGQEELRRMWESSKPKASLSPLEYAKTNAASLSPMTPQQEWYEVELTADTGACDTVIPKDMCPGIPILPSYQSLNKMEYEVASGESIPNLGERRCETWTEGAEHPKAISMQVADVHKALLSLSRCADMGFESRFGSAFGCLIDTMTGEVVPLQRKGNLYVLKAWIRAAPFGRQERQR